MAPTYDLQAIFGRFDTRGKDFSSAETYGSGHINDTFRIKTTDDTYFILQRINHEIFTRPVEVMANIERVTEHLARKIQERDGDPTRETLTLVRCKPNGDNDATSFTVVEGNYWRMYDFISGAKSYEIGEDSSCDGNGDEHDYVKEAAAAFARFQRDMADLPPPRLHETIPHFGDTSFRFQQFEEALAADAVGRAGGCRAEIEFAQARRSDASKLGDMVRKGGMPERIAHFDTKINNILIDNASGSGLCVIDLDTVMPGLAIYDFGDAVRAATALAAEDETDLSRVGFSLEKFEQLTHGYLSVAAKFLTDVEIDHLAFAARIVTMTIGLRFLADHLAGDKYFKTQRKAQNLDRCRTQFKTAEEMEKRYDEMKAIVEKYRRRYCRESISSIF
mmetsp:Transcript_9750/g.16150  ORF Transcript_9750/g.16150 Transcript_9750/m.16150 type:complete len:391 (-) Transcript_9750:56-1228(-)